MSRIFIEGGSVGPNSKDQQTRLREGFSKLLERMGLKGRMPKLVACGGRDNAFRDFCIALRESNEEYTGLWIDSEAPVGLTTSDSDPAWDSLKARILAQGDNTKRIPVETSDDKILLMVTCMETWILADRKTLEKLYGADFKPKPLLPLENLETRPSHEVLNSLERATAACKNTYCKGSRSFAVFGELNPEELRKHLGSFRRVERILQKHL